MLYNRYKKLDLGLYYTRSSYNLHRVPDIAKLLCTYLPLKRETKFLTALSKFNFDGVLRTVLIIYCEINKPKHKLK